MRNRITAAAIGCLALAGAAPAGAATTPSILVGYLKPQTLGSAASVATFTPTSQPDVDQPICTFASDYYETGLGWNHWEQDSDRAWTFSPWTQTVTDGATYRYSVAFYDCDGDQTWGFDTGWYSRHRVPLTRVGTSRAWSWTGCFVSFAPIVWTQPGGAKLTVTVSGTRKGVVSTSSATGLTNRHQVIQGFGSGTPGQPVCGRVVLRAGAGRVNLEGLLVQDQGAFR